LAGAVATGSQLDISGGLKRGGGFGEEMALNVFHADLAHCL
jgi:hypothetical protein